MNINKVADNIYFVGVNDRVTTRFEGLWSLPYGVSLNSYLIRGEKVALIDTVSVGDSNNLIANLNLVSSKIDYLIVNHMEPDHSGAIPEIIAHNPGIKVVTNKIAIGMIKGFYHIDDDSVFMEVKDGDTLDLGNGQTLRFYMTPMVHWPETMMTYLESSKMLFSGDAFGTFGALSGEILDSAYLFEDFENEMRRYYTAIVAKYSVHVQKALKKLAGVELEYICPTHGPVWHDYINEVVDAYNNMSLQEPEDGVVIVYGTMYGNTAAMAEQVATSLRAEGVKTVKIYDAGATEMSFILRDIWRYKGLIVASPTYSMDLFPPIEALLTALRIREIKNRVTAALGSFAWAPSIAAKKIEQRLTEMGLTVADTFSVKLALNEASLQSLRELSHKFVELLNTPN